MWLGKSRVGDGGVGLGSFTDFGFGAGAGL